jgi:hypothetical protein
VSVVDLTVGPPAPPEVRNPPAGDDRAELLEDEHVPHVDESMVRSLLSGLGGTVGHLAGDQDVVAHWRFTGQELDDLTPPLTRIVNRNTGLRRAVIKGDEMAVALVLAGYLGRNVADGKRARDHRRELEGQAADAEGDGGADGQGSPGSAGGSWGDGGGLPGPSGGGLR